MTARKGSLLVVGTGITGIGQITLEAVAAMERAERLHYLVIEPTTDLWIRGLNPQARTLGDLYQHGKKRQSIYAEMTSRLLDDVRKGHQVCAAFYGHPGVLVQATHDAIRRLRRDGYPARMLPGVSSDACLFADLGLNPGDEGLQSFEATDFMLSRRRIDPTSSLILWQVGVLGEDRSLTGARCRPDWLDELGRTLRRHYPAHHRVILYYAAMFPGRSPLIRRVTLARLSKEAVTPLALLYVPPLSRRSASRRLERLLNH